MTRVTRKQAFALMMSLMIMLTSFAVIPANAHAAPLVDGYSVWQDYHVLQHNEDIEAIEQNALTGTLGIPIGMQGFDGDYALGLPDEVVEIIVQFITPPYVALRHIHERDIPLGRALPGISFEEQALSAHTAFQQQLGQIFMPFGAAPVEIIGEYHELFNGVFMRVPSMIVQSISALPEVFAVFPNISYTAEPLPYGHVTGFMPVSAFPHNNAARELFNIDYIHNVLGFTGAGVRVAVLDSGVDYNHPDLMRYRDPSTGRIRGRNFVPGYPPGVRDLDSMGHGTHVSGTVVAMAPDIELWHYRILGSARTGSIIWVIDAVTQARNDGVDVINFSMQGNAVDVWNPLNDVFNLAVMDGIVIVISAGNFQLTTRHLGVFGAAALPILVAAGTSGGIGQSQDTITNFSSRGPVPITFHIKPDIVAPGMGIHSTFPGGGYRTFEGTSMATPAVAGIAALIIQAHPGISPHDVKARIMNTARPLTDLAPNCAFTVGAGFIQPIKALQSHTIVTAQHPIPWGTSASMATHGNFKMSPHMASFSFGNRTTLFPGDNINTIPGTIRNLSNHARTYTIEYSFNINPNAAARMTLSRRQITVGPGGTGHFSATLSLQGLVAGAAMGNAGHYSGYIYLRDAGTNTVAARLPFGMANAVPVTVPANLLSFDLGGTAENPTNPLSIDSINVMTGVNLQNFLLSNHRGFALRYGGFPTDNFMLGPTRAGYAFIGWYTNPDFTPGARLTSTTTMPSAATTLFARWSAVCASCIPGQYTCTVCWDAFVNALLAQGWGGPGATRQEAIADWTWWYNNRTAWEIFVDTLIADGWGVTRTEAVAAWQAWYAAR